MYERILIPTDGSDVAENAVEHGIALAEKYGAEVHALYVLDLNAIDVSLGTEQVDRIKSGKFDEMPELQERARRATGHVADSCEERGLAVVESVVAGRPHLEIDGYAEKHDVDLIVMGSAGRGGVKRMLLGSVAERTLRETTTPVLIVCGRED